jgi:hypothetical protein
MLGDGIVSFGVVVVTHDWRNSKSGAKIGSCSAIGASTWSAAGVNSSVPSRCGTGP